MSILLAFIAVAVPVVLAELLVHAGGSLTPAAHAALRLAGVPMRLLLTVFLALGLNQMFEACREQNFWLALGAFYVLALVGVLVLDSRFPRDARPVL